MRTVYVLRNHEGEPLYVGCSFNLNNRRGMWRKLFPWFDEIDLDHIAVFNVDDEYAALVERAVISLVQPRHNVDGISRDYRPPASRHNKAEAGSYFLSTDRRFLEELFRLGLTGAFDSEEKAA